MKSHSARLPEGFITCQTQHLVLSCLQGTSIVNACHQAGPKLLTMLESPTASSRQAAAVTICNLACHGREIQSVVAAMGMPSALSGFAVVVHSI